MINRQKKVVLIGNFSVGKTSLIRRFVDNSFSDSYISTIGVKISKKNIYIHQYQAELTLLIWDIEGTVDTIKRVNKTYMSGASGGIIVIDVTSVDVKNNTLMHLNDFYSINLNRPVIIAFNKIDKDEGFDIDISDIKRQYPMVIDSFKTSAKTGLNVEIIFETLSKEILDGYQL